MFPDQQKMTIEGLLKLADEFVVAAVRCKEIHAALKKEISGLYWEGLAHNMFVKDMQSHVNLLLMLQAAFENLAKNISQRVNLLTMSGNI